MNQSLLDRIFNLFRDREEEKRRKNTKDKIKLMSRQISDLQNIILGMTQKITQMEAEMEAMKTEYYEHEVLPNEKFIIVVD